VLMHAGWDRKHRVTSRKSLAASPNIELATPKVQPALECGLAEI
jgi:hypothetical protein